MAITGHNGDNESYIGFSSSIELSCFDEDANEIKLKQSSMPIDIIISRDPIVSNNQYQYINKSQTSSDSLFLQNGFNIISNNASIHIELKPFDINVGYLIVMKLGFSPIFNSAYSDYDSLKVFCPSIKVFFRDLE